MTEADTRRPDLPHLEADQQILFSALLDRGIEGRSLLDVGCGTGRLHHRLLAEGASSAVGVELSEEYLEKARALSLQLGHQDRTSYLKGDFMKLADRIEPADLVLLDKVVHCTHDPQTLIQQSAAHAQTLVALTFPANRPLLRLSMQLLGPILRLVLPFRVRFTAPDQIRAWIRGCGFERAFWHDSEMWHTEIYRRCEAPVD